MKMKIYYSNGILDIEIKDMYTKEIINEALENSAILSLTQKNNNDITLMLNNIIAIEYIN